MEGPGNLSADGIRPILLLLPVPLSEQMSISSDLSELKSESLYANENSIMINNNHKI